MNKKMFRIIVSLVAIIFFLVLVFLNNKNSNPQLQAPYDKKVMIDDVLVMVEIADTLKKQAQGLSDRAKLKDGQGMLFSYDPPQSISFWMKDMLIPIDIIFIKDNQVIKIFEGVQPEPEKTNQQLTRYSANQAIDYVLEVPADWSQKNNIKVNSTFDIRP
jgi:uncharacterized protein